MDIKTQTITYGPAGIYSGYAAYPERHDAALPGVIVFQEIYGVDGHIRDVTRRYAEAGYFAFAPDLYAQYGNRLAPLAEPRIEAVKRFMDKVPFAEMRDPAKRDSHLSKLPPQEAKEVGESLQALFGGMDLTRRVPQLVATTAFLREENSLTLGQRIGSVGFCMGGGLSGLLAASDPSLAAAIIYYGRSPTEPEVEKIACPILGFYGELDVPITSTVPQLAEQMKRSGKSFEHHVFKGAYHAFFNDQRTPYNAAAARWSYARALAFFGEHLALDPHA